MTYLNIKLKDIRPAEISYIAGSLQKGKVIVTPTDTIYGLSCLANNRKAIRKVNDIKNRDHGKPLLILVSSLSMLKKYVYVNTRQERGLKKLWAKNAVPTTVILRSRNILPKEIEGGTGALGVRLPKSEFLIKMIRKVGEPIISTSLNISGQASIYHPKNLEKYFSEKHRPDLVIEAGSSKTKKASRLIDLREAKKKVIRE